MIENKSGTFLYTTCHCFKVFLGSYLLVFTYQCQFASHMTNRFMKCNQNRIKKYFWQYQLL